MVRAPCGNACDCGPYAGRGHERPALCLDARTRRYKAKAALAEAESGTQEHLPCDLEQARMTSQSVANFALDR